MSKEIISDKTAITLVVMFLFGSSLILPTGSAAGSDIWIAILLAMVMAIPMLLIYSRILSLYPGKDLFDVLIITFGNFLGRLLCLFFAWFAFHVGALVLRNFGEYIVTVSFPETPMIIPIILLAILSIWIVKAGIEVIARWSWLFFIFNSPAPTIVLLALIPQMDVNNITPIMYDGFRPVLHGALSAFSFPFAETVIFTMVFFCLKNRKSPYKVYLSGLFLGGIPLLGISLAEMLVLGPDSYGASYYPNHGVATKVGIGTFLQRLEVIVLIAAVTGGFVKISVCLFAACNGIAKAFGIKNYRNIVFPIGLLMISTSYLMYDSLLEQIPWFIRIWFYYASIFQIIFPIIIFIVIEVKKKFSTS